MRHIKRLFIGAGLMLSTYMFGCNSTETIPIPAPSNLTYSQNSVAYVFDLTIADNVPSVNGTVIRYSIAPDLPSGLRFNDSSGIISGYPFSPSPATQYVVTATNSGGSTTDTLTIAITQTAPYYLSYTSPISYAVGVAATNTPTVLGALNQFSISPALPAGLSLNTFNGIISGTPTTTSPSKSYSVKGMKGADSAKATINITVYDIPPSNLSYESDSNSYVGGVPINDNPATVTGVATHYSISPALPAGLLINDTTGIISGTPTSISPAASYTITASNALGSTTAIVKIGVNWMLRARQLNLTSIASSGSQIVAVGSGGSITTSTDGITWTPRVSGTTNALNFVVWCGSQWITVGNAGTILSSSDGITWKARVSGTINTLNSAVWTGSQFVAVGNGGAIVTSTDGAVWTMRASGTTNTFTAIASSANQIVAVGDSSYYGLIYTSTNGSTWVARAVSGGISDLSSITWTGSQFVSVGFVYMLTSPDGINWTSNSSPINGVSILNFVTWSNNTLIVGAFGGLYTSQDGTNWTNRNLPFDASAVVSFGNQFVVSSGGAILTSF